MEKYERSLDIAPLRLSHADLMRLIGKLRSLTETANQGTKTRLPGSETLDLSSGDLTLSLETGFSSDDLRRAPANAYSVRYSFTRYDAPISRVDLDLYDYKRTFRVIGSDADQVDAMVAAFQHEISESTTTFGGPGFRYWTGGLLLLIAWALGNAPFILVGRMTHRIIFWSVGAVILLALLVAPFSRWFPGVAVYTTEASFIVRNNAWISFIGAFVTVIGLVVTVVLHLRSSRRRLLSTDPIAQIRADQQSRQDGP